ncbi:uncharacterized protein DUF4003 [Alkalibaculum bacchi]|uniref:Uncharacterized protein DUF4003 n=1 Tax=Alkalibaculum bacchi TaxID=645887 RepID=A0A366IA78_9FIRM|nr:DUF4003 family protein [Alkalibaculum bacchi]RBP66647.1 uncharacterized protein DUF4003 [Alkalibaculum bacchi]
MDNVLKQRCELFVRNRDIMKNHFRWDHSSLHPLCGSMYTERQLEVDEVKIKECKDIIKSNTGLLSPFRSTTNLILATVLSLESQAVIKFQKVLRIYDLLRKEFYSSDYLPLSAFVMADMVKDTDYKRVVEKAKEIYKRMKKEHPFLTSSEDSGFAIMFAISDLTVEEAITEMEKCYNFLQTQFFSANAVQSLSHALALGEENFLKKCNKVMEIFEGLKNRDCKFGTGVELAILGVLAMTTENTQQVINDIVEVNEYLLSFKGFGALGIAKKQRLMYSAILVEQEYKRQCENKLMEVASINSITSIIIAEQIAVTAAITASVTATNAANS